MAKAKTVKKKLKNIIQEMAQSKDLFVKNPGKDFSRNRKLNFETMMKLMITMEAGSQKNELYSFFNCDINTPTSSAFIQQRSKIKTEAFNHIIYELNSSFKTKKYKGYDLLACDGSSVSIPLDQGESEYVVARKGNSKKYFQMHVNALYDLMNHRYRDMTTSPRQKNDERNELIKMIKRGDFSPKTIFIADRGYEGYGIIGQINFSGMFYLFRAKDSNDGGLVKSFNLPKEGEYDVTITRKFTFLNNKKVRNNPEIYKRIHKSKSNGFLTKEEPYKEMTIRIVRIKITDNNYECLITNLPKENFSKEELKKLYNMRWGIETSFRELKYTVGITSLHSKKPEYIEQEIFAKCIMYNFSEIITLNVAQSTATNTKYKYQVNYTLAIKLCRQFLKQWDDNTPFDIEVLIAREVLPIRPGRNYSRNKGYHSAVAFQYRTN